MRFVAVCFGGGAALSCLSDPCCVFWLPLHLDDLQLAAAPSAKAGSKMRTSSHFDSGGARRRPTDDLPGGGKLAGGIGAGHNSFGAGLSSRNGGGPQRVVQAAPGGFTLVQLQEHDARLQQHAALEAEKTEAAQDDAPPAPEPD